MNRSQLQAHAQSLANWFWGFAVMAVLTFVLVDDKDGGTAGAIAFGVCALIAMGRSCAATAAADRP